MVLAKALFCSSQTAPTQQLGILLIAGNPEPILRALNAPFCTSVVGVPITAQPYSYGMIFWGKSTSEQARRCSLE